MCVYVCSSERKRETSGGGEAEGGGATASQCHEHPKDALWLLEQLQLSVVNLKSSTTVVPFRRGLALALASILAGVAVLQIGF